MNSKSKIYDIINERLSGVAFVQDYVEFHFDEKVIRSLANPVLIMQDKTFEFPNLGSRDFFCSLIGRTLNNIVLEEEDSICLIFDAETRLIIPLSESKQAGPEAAHYVPGLDQPIEVW